MKKGIMITFGLMLSLSFSSFCGNDPLQVALRMKSFFTQTLIATYGKQPESQLYHQFLVDFKDKKGEVLLTVNTDSLETINQLLFSDSIYDYYYPGLLFFNSYDDFKKSEENNKEIGQNSIIFFNKKDQTTTKYGVYLNKNSYFKYMVDRNAHIKAIREINAYYSLSGILSYFMFTDMMLNDINVLENEEMKELTVVVFWKYLCEMAGIVFYK